MMVLPSPVASTGSSSVSAPFTGVSFKANCKSALSLVNERRIEFVRAKNVRVLGKIDTSTGKPIATNDPKKNAKKVLVESEAIERLLSWQHSKKIGPGFANLGNTCYLNSVLQCLAYTPCFVQYLLENERVAPASNNHSKKNLFMMKHMHNGSHSASGPFCSMRVMARLLQSIHGKPNNNNSNGGGGRVLQPKEMVMNIRHISKSFRIGRQEDSHEFFRLLLDSMQRSCLRNANIKQEDHPAGPTSFIHRVFGGKLKNSLKCAKCNFVSERLDDFLDLSLEINNGIKSVKGALQHFTAIETLDDRNAWKCSSCRQLNRAEKGMTIEACPNVLVIQLKRFDVMFGKIKKHIEFPISLDIASRTSKTSEDRKRGRTKYELHAVLVHAGFSTDCGHYYAFVKGSSGQWYEMNDECVRWVSLDTVLQQKAYMLFYSRVLPPSERPKPKAKTEATAEAKQVEVKTNAEAAIANSINRSEKEEIPVKVVTSAPSSELQVVVPSKPKELSMNGFLASLRTSVVKGDDDEDDASAATKVNSHELKTSTKAVKKTVETFTITKRLESSTMQLKRPLMPAFSGLVGKLYKFRSTAWTPSSALTMTRTVKEIQEEDVDTTSQAQKQTVPVATPKPTEKPFVSKPVKVAFDPRHLKNIGVKNAALFGQEVNKWADESGETTSESLEHSTEDESTTSAAVHDLDKQLASQHDRLLQVMKQEDWKHRNAGRLDYWDEALDTGKVKKVKKRKEFIANQGAKNAFQLVLQKKKQRTI